MFTKYLIISTLIIYAFIKLIYVIVQKIILNNTERKILIEDEKICYLPKPLNGIFFIMAFVWGSGFAYFVLPFILYGFQGLSNEISHSQAIILESITIISIISGLSISILFCCKKIIITNKRIIISSLFTDSNKIPKHEDFLPENIISLNVILYSYIKFIEIKTKEGSKTFLRVLNDPDIVLYEIKKCLNL